MGDEIDELQVATWRFLQYVIRSYDIKSIEDFKCPHCRRMAEILLERRVDLGPVGEDGE